MKPVVIDIFAGAGGLSLGFERAGFDVVASVDIDPVHCAVHAYNFPHTKSICADISKLSGKQLRKLVPSIVDTGVDVLCGGPPCQGFSTMGKHREDDPRNMLVFQFIRLIGELKPNYFVLENVPGLLADKHNLLLERIVSEIEALNYRLVKPFNTLNSADFGVPQKRERLFIIGGKKNLELPKYPIASEQKSVISVWDAIGDLPDVDAFEELLERDWIKIKLGKPSTYVKNLQQFGGDFTVKRQFNRSILTSSRRTIHSRECKKRFENTPHGQFEPISRFYKLDPDGLSHTLRAGTGVDRGAFMGARPIHPFAARCITVREAARLHSYPDWFRFHVTKWHGFRQIGNSVPPHLAAAVASEIMKLFRVRRRRSLASLKLGDPRLLELSLSDAAKFYEVDEAIVGRRTR